MLDQPDSYPLLLADDLRNLKTLNRLFGGRAVIERHLPGLLRVLPGDRTMRILDIGSGAGDLCRAAVETCIRNGRRIRLWSLDAHAPLQDYARAELRDLPQIGFLRGDARRLPLRDACVDLSLCTLALHHFREGDAAAVLAEMRRVTARWALVSDLRRSETAFAAVWGVTRLMPNPMTRHDGPLSVRRAYTEGELVDLARRAGWDEVRFFREPWFRMSLLHTRREPR